MVDITNENGDGGVEAVAQHVVSSDDLRLGYAAQHAAEEAVEYKLARMLTLSGAELTSVKIEWICRGVATGVKPQGRVIEHQEVRRLPVGPTVCVICGAPAVVGLRCAIHG